MKTKYLIGALFLIMTVTTAWTQENDQSQKTKKTAMKEFILMVRVPLTYTSEQARAVNPAWDKVLEKWKADNIWVASFVFPQEGSVVKGSERVVKKEFVISSNLKIVSSIVLKAADRESAIELAKACPILEHGGSVEVREVQPNTNRPGN